MKILLSAILLFSLSLTQAQTITGNGKITTFNKSLPGVIGVESALQTNVQIILGDREEIEIKTDENILPEIKLKFKNGTVSVWRSDKKMKKISVLDVTVYCKQLVNISQSGSGKITCAQTIKGDRIEIQQAGSGDIKVKVDVGSVNLELAGSGEIYVEGTAKELNSAMAGSGDIVADKLVVESAEVQLAGSGSFVVHATKSISGDLAGSGDIKVWGEPENINVDVVGSGKVSKYVVE